MQFKHKLIYFALGCAFVVIGQVLLSVVIPKVTAQGKKEAVELDKLRVQSLEVVDDEGKVCVLLEKKPRNATVDDVIKAFNDDGVLIYNVGRSGRGGNVNVYDNNARVRATMSIGNISNAGVLELYGNDGKLSALIGGHIGGGIVSIHRNGDMRAAMYAHDYGGHIDIFGNDGKRKVAIGVNEYGHGGVNTWDKNGYRLR